MEEPRGNGTGKHDLDRIKDEEIARLRAKLAERDSDPPIGSTVKHWRRMITAVSGVIALCSALFAGLAWYTSSAVGAAMAAERLATQDRIDTSLRMQLSQAHFAPMETVAVQEQRLTDIDRRLAEINAKLDTLLLRVRPR